MPGQQATQSRLIENHARVIKLFESGLPGLRGWRGKGRNVMLRAAAASGECCENSPLSLHPAGVKGIYWCVPCAII